MDIDASTNIDLKHGEKEIEDLEDIEGQEGAKRVTIVTAIDENYLEFLKLSLPNWIKYKRIDRHPMIVFVNGIDIKDERLYFLRKNNITLIPWNENCMDKVDSHRELMLSAFVFGCAEHVKTDYWIKIDADSYATNYSPLYTNDFKKYSIIAHRWGYSRPQHVEGLDKWASTHWDSRLKNSRPMIEQGTKEGNRFYHNKKRFCSYICFQKTSFTKLCISFLKNKRLPVPSQDTYAYFLIQKLNPEQMGAKNFKRHHGFTWCSGKHGAEKLKACLEQVDLNNKYIIPIKEINDIEDSEDKNIEDGFQKNIDIKVDFPKIEQPPTKKYICPEGLDTIIEIREIK